MWGRTWPGVERKGRLLQEEKRWKIKGAGDEREGREEEGKQESAWDGKVSLRRQRLGIN